MRYARPTTFTEIDTRFRVFRCHNIPDSSRRWRIDRLPEPNPAASRHACTFVVTASQHTSEFVFEKIFLAGLVLQLVSFTLFSSIYVHFLYRVYTLEHGIWGRDKGQPWYRDWRTLATALAISCIGILVSVCGQVDIQ